MFKFRPKNLFPEVPQSSCIFWDARNPFPRHLIFLILDTHTNTHTHRHTHAHTQTQTHKRTHTHTHKHTHTHTNRHTYMHTQTHTHIHIHNHTNSHTHTRTCTKRMYSNRMLKQNVPTQNLIKPLFGVQAQVSLINSINAVT